jgi:hypothetical protein
MTEILLMFRTVEDTRRFTPDRHVRSDRNPTGSWTSTHKSFLIVVILFLKSYIVDVDLLGIDICKKGIGGVR